MSLGNTQDTVPNSSQAYSPVLPIGPPERVANRSWQSEPDAARCINTIVSANEPQVPQAKPRDTRSQLTRSLPLPNSSPLLSPQIPIEPRQSDVVRTASHVAPGNPQYVLSHSLPLHTEAPGRARRPMHNLPPIRTLDDGSVEWPATPVITGQNIPAGPLHGYTSLPTVDRDHFHPIHAQSSGQPASAWELSLVIEVITPRHFKTLKYEPPGGWPADFPQTLLRALEAVLAQGNRLPDDFNVSPNHFRYADRYHCPFCLERNWKGVTRFFSHLQKFHYSSA